MEHSVRDEFIMELPINYKNRPYRQKYLDEETPQINAWFIFGKHDDGSVDIADRAGDIFVEVPPEIAEEIIEARRSFIRVVTKHFTALAN